MAIVEGESIELKAIFSKNKINTDPGTPVKVTIKKPDGTLGVDGENCLKVETGVFNYVYETDMPGTYHFKIVSADGSIEQDKFKVEQDKTKED